MLICDKEFLACLQSKFNIGQNNGLVLSGNKSLCYVI